MPLIIFSPIGRSQEDGLCILSIGRMEDNFEYGWYTLSRISLPLSGNITYRGYFVICLSFNGILFILCLLFGFVVFFFFFYFSFLPDASTGDTPDTFTIQDERIDSDKMEWCSNMINKSYIPSRNRKWWI